MAARIDKAAQKAPSKPDRAHRPHPAEASLKASNRSLRLTYQAVLPQRMVDAAQELWAKDFGYLSIGHALGLAGRLASNYMRRGCVDGWTPETFYALIQQSQARRVSSTTVRKWGGMLTSAGFFVIRRAHNSPTGTMLRVFLCDAVLSTDRAGRMAAAAVRRRQLDTEAKRRRRAAASEAKEADRRRDPRRNPANRMSPGEIDQIDQELEILSQNLAARSAVPPSNTAGSATPAEHGASASFFSGANKKQIPLTPTPPAQGRVELSSDRPQMKASEDASASFASPEALENHLYRFIAGQPVSAAPKLRSQVGPVIYQALVRTHQHGLQGLKASHMDAVRRACGQVARAHAPRPKTARQRAERFRLRIDRQAGAASRSELAEAAEAILGSVAARGINPAHLAHLGLSLAQAEDALGRVQRQLRIGSAGPTALRTPGALGAYAMATFRRQDRGAPRAKRARS